MTTIIFTVKDKEVPVELSIIPEGSELAMRYRNRDKSNVSYKITDISYMEFKHMIKFLKTGIISKKETSRFIEILDLYRCLSFDYYKYLELHHIPYEFMKILQEEEWFRLHYYKEGYEYLQHNDSRLLQLTEVIYKSMELLQKTLWKYVGCT